MPSPLPYTNFCPTLESNKRIKSTLLWRSPSCAFFENDSHYQVCSVRETKVDGMLHEGTIPDSASRMTMLDIIMSFGHGLRGLLPRIPGTMSLLSVWENGLERHMPEMHITANSMLFVHANDFSCQMPRHQDVTPKRSLALIGNHFAKPLRVPAWITTAEQPSDMFCVSEEQCKRFVMTFLCGACIFCLATFGFKSTNEVMYGRFARARSAWNETSQLQSRGCPWHAQSRPIICGFTSLPQTQVTGSIWFACTRASCSRQHACIADTSHGVSEKTLLQEPNQGGGKGLFLLQAAGFTYCGFGLVCWQQLQ
eukprot:6470634-Amphidinium_carterae.1